MGSLSARLGRVPAFAAAAIILCGHSSAAEGGRSEVHSDTVPASLCDVGETVLFSCPLRGRLVSVCGQAPARSIYRFGRPGRIELQSRDLRHASRMFSGGGESQIHFERDGYRYILFDRTVRASFASEGRNEPQVSSGLLVQHAGRLRTSTPCGGSGEAAVSSALAAYMPEGVYIPH
jgi:hypothetical protein